jgi:hypothetical protein
MLRTFIRASAFAVVLLPGGLCAQSMVFHFTDGSTETFALAAIRKTTFAGTEQVLWLTDGTQYVWDLNGIDRVEFPDIATGVQHIASGWAPLDLRLSPNPSAAEVAIATELQYPGRLVVDVLDAQGRSVRRLFKGEPPVGPFRIYWDGADGQGGRVPPATYWVRLATATGSTARPVVIH